MLVVFRSCCWIFTFVVLMHGWVSAVSAETDRARVAVEATKRALRFRCRVPVTQTLDVRSNGAWVKVSKKKAFRRELVSRLSKIKRVRKAQRRSKRVSQAISRLEISIAAFDASLADCSPTTPTPLPGIEPTSTAGPTVEPTSHATPQPTNTATPQPTNTPTTVPTSTPEPYIPPYPDGTNIALGKSYEFSAAPNYSLTTDSGDSMQLTDGIIYAGTKALWTLPEAVGWSYIFDPICITTDLEISEPVAISNIAFTSAAKIASGVFFPTAFAYVSDDSANWYFAGVLTQEAISQANTLRKFELTGLHVRARYISICFMMTGTLAFMDEVEVRTGSEDPENLMPEGSPISTEGLGADVEERAPLAVENTASLYFIQAGIDALLADGASESNAFIVQLQALANEVKGNTVVSEESREKGMPYSETDALTAEIVGQYMQGQGKNPLELWQKDDRYLNVGPFERPVSSMPVSLAADMMIGEREIVSFLVTNNTPNPTSISLAFTPGQGFDIQTAFYQGRYVLVHGYQFLDDAVVLVVDDSVEIPAGMTVQIYVELHSEASTAGAKGGFVTVSTAGAADTIIPLVATVYSVSMPENPEFLTGAFSYFGEDYIEQHAAQVAEQLEDFYLNVQTINSAHIPTPKMGLAPLDFSALNEVVALQPNARVRLLFMGAPDNPAITPLLTSGKPEDEELFKDWIASIRDNFSAQGIGIDEWAIQLADEPTVSEFTTYIVKAAELIAELNPKPRIFQNWNISDLDDSLADYPGSFDICSPTKSRLAANSAAIIPLCAAAGEDLWMYDSTNSRAHSPLTYFRLYIWSAFSYSAHYLKWAYLTDGEDSWNRYTGARWSMAYAGADGPIASKRMIGLRDGIEDRALLQALSDKALATGDESLSELLNEAVAEVLANTSSTSILEARRKEILQTMD